VSAADRLDSKKNRAKKSNGCIDKSEKDHRMIVAMHVGMAVCDVICIHEFGFGFDE
jgi:hypothetical protein